MDTENTEAAPRRRRASRSTAVLVAAAGVALAGVGVAAAQTSDGAGSTTPAPAARQAPADQTPPPPDGPDGPGGQHGPGGPGGPGGRHKGHGGPGGMGGAIHGEFVRPDGNGGFQTLDEQLGKVTNVSNSSIEVKSDDGFTKTYAVDEGTLVNAGRDGIGDVKKDDVVRLTAVVTGSTAKAVRIMDVTTTEALRQQWAPKRQAPAQGQGQNQAQPQATPSVAST